MGRGKIIKVKKSLAESIPVEENHREGISP
jgi:hypothetical protein